MARSGPKVFGLWAASVLVAACGSDSHSSSSPSTDGGKDAAPGAPDANQDAAALDGASRDSAANDPCSPESFATPTAGTTYYVAISEPGADDAACDGLAPTNEGGGHCPFKDFSSTRTASLLDGKSNVRVSVRAGTYVISGWDGFRITGTGTSEAERVILSAHGDGPVIFDVPSGDGAACTGTDPQSNPDCVREVLRISGQYTQVQGIRVQNGLAYDVEVTGGAHHVVRCVEVAYTMEFAQRSDGFKLDADAHDVLVQSGKFSGWHSQAIDMAGTYDVRVEKSEFTAPHDADGGAVGMKFGTHDVTIIDNYVHDLGSDPGMHAFSLGGTGTPHGGSYEAEALHVTGNRVSNIRGILAQVVSCKGCSLEDNVVTGAGAGILLAGAGTGTAECTDSASGCLPTTGAIVRGNRFRDLDGNGDPAQSNVFVVVEDGEGTGFDAGENVYCASSSGSVRFGWGGGGFVDFATWKTQSGTDGTSGVHAAGEGECGF